MASLSYRGLSYPCASCGEKTGGEVTATRTSRGLPGRSGCRAGAVDSTGSDTVPHGCGRGHTRCCPRGHKTEIWYNACGPRLWTGSIAAAHVDADLDAVQDLWVGIATVIVVNHIVAVGTISAQVEPEAGI